MTSRLVIGFVVAATLAACATPNGTARAPRPLKPQDGPHASLYVDHSGGAFSRHIRARFRLDKAGYVMVGHLGGDGQIRVLYPETPYGSGWVAGGKTIAVKPTLAYDMAPHLYSFANAHYRTLGAMDDSYDGRGHGYVFIVTSRYPIYLGAFAGNRSFEPLEVQDYDSESDPRIAVRELADDLTTGPYTLRYALSDARLSRYSLATGCPTHWGLTAYDPYFGPWSTGYALFGYPGMSIVNAFAFAHYSGYGQRSCRGSHSALSSEFFYRTRVTAMVPPSTPTAPLTPQLQRRERRTLTDRGRTAILGGQSSIDRGGATWARRARGSTSSEVHRPPERTSRPLDTPRMTTRTTPTTPTTTNPGSSASGREKKTE